MKYRPITFLGFPVAGITVCFVATVAVGAPPRGEARHWRVDKRVEQIEKARQRDPDLFAKVADCCELVLVQGGDIIRRANPTIKGFTLDLLHPKYRSAADAHPGVYAEAKAAFDRAQRRMMQVIPAHRSGILGDVHEEIKAIVKEAGLSGETAELVTGAVYLRPRYVELDPVVLPALEAVLLDPEVPWVVKGYVGSAIARFEDPRSAASLGQYLNEAMHAFKSCKADGPSGPGFLSPKEKRKMDGAGRQTDPCEEIRLAASRVHSAIHGRPRGDTALAVSIWLHDADVEHIRRSVKRYKDLPQWVAVFKELVKDPELAVELRPLSDEVLRERNENEED